MTTADLDALCAMLHNYFNIHHDADIHRGSYTIVNGRIESLPFLVNGQYFRILGSALNDGVHQYPATDLADETFDGAIWAMFVPRDVLRLAEQIADYNEQVQRLVEAEASLKGYTSETLSGFYSYSIGSTAPPGMEAVKADIDAKFRRYRKLVIF